MAKAQVGGAVDPRRPRLGVRLVPGTHPADSAIATGREQAGRRAAFVSQKHRTVNGSRFASEPAPPR
jgi:hypothetical protein